MASDHHVLGIDVGGSGIKGGIIDVQSGQMLTDRLRLETPKPATPAAVADTFAALVKMHNWDGLIGSGFPAIVKNGVARSAANIDKSWVGVNVEKLFSEVSGLPVKVVNDADAAGIAAMTFGAGKGHDGVVLILTIGTGIGSALFTDGILTPNTEFGHLFFYEDIAEKYVSDSARKRDNLSWNDWGMRFDKFLHQLGRLFSPDLVILSGGASKQFDSYKDLFTVDFEVVPSMMLNHAGSIGAAYYAWQSVHSKSI